ncbi:MAG: 5'-nucleotidase [Burkholderiaceae bacterium]
MGASLNGQLVVAISSRALFNLEEENQVFEESDDRAYMQLQLERLEQTAQPGVAFSLVKKLLAFNDAQPGDAGEPAQQRVEVVMLSRNDPVSGLRVFRSAQAHQLGIVRGVFTRGREPYHYLPSLQANLFLSANAGDVKAALKLGFPAATVATHSQQARDNHPHEVRIAFDGDAVLFSDEAEQVFQRSDLPTFQQHEKERAHQPLAPGPLQPLLKALQRLQREGTSRMRLRTSLVTARSAPAHDRAIRTLMSWNIEIDEAMFLGGLPKGEFLRAFDADFFFDDQIGHIQSAAQHVPAGHVHHGVRNA